MGRGMGLNDPNEDFHRLIGARSVPTKSNFKYWRWLDAQEVQEFPDPRRRRSAVVDHFYDGKVWVSKYGAASVQRLRSFHMKDKYILSPHNLRGLRTDTLHCPGTDWNDFPFGIFGWDDLKWHGIQCIEFHSDHSSFRFMI